jgi:hypothetical protein
VQTQAERAAHRFGFSRMEERKNETFREHMNALGGCTQGRFLDSGASFAPSQVCRQSLDEWFVCFGETCSWLF